MYSIRGEAGPHAVRGRRAVSETLQQEPALAGERANADDGTGGGAASPPAPHRRRIRPLLTAEGRRPRPAARTRTRAAGRGWCGEGWGCAAHAVREGGGAGGRQGGDARRSVVGLPAPPRLPAAAAFVAPPSACPPSGPPACAAYRRASGCRVFAWAATPPHQRRRRCAWCGTAVPSVHPLARRRATSDVQRAVGCGRQRWDGAGQARRGGPCVGAGGWVPRRAGVRLHGAGACGVSAVAAGVPAIRVLFALSPPTASRHSPQLYLSPAFPPPLCLPPPPPPSLAPPAALPLVAATRHGA